LSQRAYVVRISEVAPGVKQFELRGAAGSRLLPFSAGAHVVITIRDQDRVLHNPYSIMGTPPEGDGYVISVRNSLKSRGGSWFLHNRVQVGCELEISLPINNFAVANGARRHILIAGGMGITPMLAMLEELQRDKANVELHYGVRSEIDGRFVSKLPSDVTGVTRIYSSDRGERIPLQSVLGERSVGSHVYVCGPQRLIDAVLDAARRSGWPKEAIHCESANSIEGPKTVSAHNIERTSAYSDSGMLQSYLMKMRELAEPATRQNPSRRTLNSPLRKAAKSIPAGCSLK
jgi:ferredoxin-NADP reductase